MWQANYSDILGIEDSNEVLFILFVPSKDKNGVELSDQRQWVEAGAKLLGRLFGGSTIMPPAQGTWLNPENDELLMEEIVLVHSYARIADSQSTSVIEEIGRFLHRLGANTNQGEIGVVIDGVFHRIRKFTLA